MLGLLVLTILVALGVVRSNVPGYVSLKRNPGDGNGSGLGEGADPAKRVDGDNVGVELGGANGSGHPSA